MSQKQAEQAEVTMDDVLAFLEARLNSLQQHVPGGGGHHRQAIEDLRKGKPRNALDILDGIVNGLSDGFETEKERTDEQRASVLLKFLEMTFFGKSGGMSHNLDDIP